jgi:hypothetical protein
MSGSKARALLLASTKAIAFAEQGQRSPKDFQMDNPLQESEANAARGKRGFLLSPELRSSSTPLELWQ